MATLCVSEEDERYLRYVFPDIPLYRTFHAIDPRLYYYDPAQKKNQVAFFYRKNVEHLKQVHSILRAHGVEYPFALIQDASREEAARVLRESKIFLSLGCPEGFSLPPAEAMACGCMVVGYDGVGAREYMKPPYAFPIEYGDIIAFVKTAKALIDGSLSVDVQAASAFIHQTYSLERERESVLNAWRSILASL